MDARFLYISFGGENRQKNAMEGGMEGVLEGVFWALHPPLRTKMRA